MQGVVLLVVRRQQQRQQRCRGAAAWMGRRQEQEGVVGVAWLELAVWELVALQEKGWWLPSRRRRRRRRRRPRRLAHGVGGEGIIGSNLVTG